MSQRLPIVDSHVHLWNLKHPDLRWDWLQPDAVHHILGNVDGIKAIAFEPPQLWAEARFAEVTAFIHVQAAIGSPDPVVETAWLTELAGKYGLPHGIVGHVDLGSDDAVRTLERHCEYPLFRGVRDFGVEPMLAAGGPTPAYEESLRWMTSHGLVLDLDCEYPNMKAAGELAGRYPELPIVLDHIGFPRRRDPDYFEAWKPAIAGLAAYPNVSCKLSGLGMTDPLFSYESLRPWVEHCIDSFGTDRCMVGSNWPVDRLYSSYDLITGYYRDFVSGLSLDEQTAILSGNATRIFKVTT